MYALEMQAFESKPPPLVAGPDGFIRVAGSRVSLETVVGAFDAGATAEEIARQYPSLPLGAVYAVISYVIENRAAVDLYVGERRNAAGALRGKIEKQVSPDVESSEQDEWANQVRYLPLR